MKALANIQRDFTQNISGYSSLGIVLSTCLGSIAIFQALTLDNRLLSMLLVLACVAICSIHNASILTVQKPIVIYRLLVTSVVFNLLVILGFIIF
ncbi:hypothetical protein [Croceivirga thetidis]|uniref:Uncharacterized protein n=1 Tax=Croceivirga thetidis TaxID=2721623 RepID=A0ABX1GRD8_9FLAO|nr:hypothetical protein [Croceivirga thetidis]NKI32498.1 hypothetical protein [Croceivirga thetidis]